MTMKESCPYCGEMTEMKLIDGVWVSDVCQNCFKPLDHDYLGIEEVVEKKPDYKAPPEADLP